MPVAYPEDLPVKSVTTLITIVKANEIIARKEEFAHALWNVQGFLQKVLVGDVVQPVGAVGKADAADALVELEAILRKAVGVSRADLNWTLLVALVQFVLSLFDRCRE